MRLIDSTTLIDKLPIVKDDKQISLIGAVADMVCMICDCPNIDAVPVVRCKDCKYFQPMPDPISCVCRRHWSGVDSDDFCSYGERRNDNERPE